MTLFLPPPFTPLVHVMSECVQILNVYRFFYRCMFSTVGHIHFNLFILIVSYFSNLYDIFCRVRPILFLYFLHFFLIFLKYVWMFFCILHIKTFQHTITFILNFVLTHISPNNINPPPDKFLNNVPISKIFLF